MEISRARATLALMVALSGLCLLAGCSAQERKAEPDRRAEAARPAPVESRPTSAGQGGLLGGSEASAAELPDDPPEVESGSGRGPAAPAATAPVPREAPAAAPSRVLPAPPLPVPGTGGQASSGTHKVVAKAAPAASRSRSARSMWSSEEPNATLEEARPAPPAAGPAEKPTPGPGPGIMPAVGGRDGRAVGDGLATGSKPEADTAEQPGYTTVKVYYGTDRAPQEAADSGVPAYVAWLAATLASFGMTLILIAVAQRYRGTRLVHGLSTLAVGVTLVLVIRTAYAVWRDASTVGRLQGDDVDYGSERGELALGTCTVSIPKDHRVGHLEGPSVLRFDFCEDPQRHVVLLGVRPQSADDFYADLKACVDRSAQKGAMVFVHGYNVKFVDAARRTAQIAYDLKFDGAPIFYSWPSQGKLSGYTVDETNVEWTVPHLKQFLAEVARRSGARQIHLIAHSMGNRALASALRDLAREPEGKRPKFREVVLTAPDIDAEIFRRDIAPAIVNTAERVTLYASSHDEALELSKEVHGYPRAGDTDDDLVIVPGVDTIDVSAVDTSLVGHSYYGSNDTVLADIFDLLHDNKPPEQRKWLRTQYLGALKYWIFARQ